MNQWTNEPMNKALSRVTHYVLRPGIVDSDLSETYETVDPDVSGLFVLCTFF